MYLWDTPEGGPCFMRPTGETDDYDNLQIYHSFLEGSLSADSPDPTHQQMKFFSGPWKRGSDLSSLTAFRS